MSPDSSQSVSSDPVTVGASSTDVPVELDSSLRESNSLSIRESVGVSPSHNRSLSFSSHASPRSFDTSIDTSCLPDSFSPGAYDSSLRSSSSVAMSPS